jgi:hypothetical protein
MEQRNQILDIRLQPQNHFFAPFGDFRRIGSACERNLTILRNALKNWSAIREGWDWNATSAGSGRS